MESFIGGTKINDSRCEILRDCIKKAENERGLYTLTVPTGAGKTLSSMAFALNHLLKNGMRRIIYVIPYTSIIEQNAKVFSDIFGKEFVLEHHSNYDFGDDEGDVENMKKLAIENWDMPIVITTNVQFFESFYANKSSRCRKLHNVSNAVIVFDEAQMLPVEYLKPCVSVISELVTNYNCSAVLCSATQPSLNQFFSKNLTPKEICSDVAKMYNIFKRTNLTDIGEISDDDLIQKLNAHRQALCIVNTRKHAQKLFSELGGEGIFHLSTLMCPVHRTQTIAEIRRCLRKNLRCIVISTQLIECGVDVDFPFVYRARCSLDSLIQSAGRCNREGKLTGENGEKGSGSVYWFDTPSDEKKRIPASMQFPIEVTNEVVRNYSDIFSPDAIKTYFHKLYTYHGDEFTDSKEIMEDLNQGYRENQTLHTVFNFNFASIAKRFQMIADNSFAVVVALDKEAQKFIEQLEHVENLNATMRKLQKYTVNIYENEYRTLLASGKIKMFADKIAVLYAVDDYDMQTGLKITFKTGQAIFL